MTITLNMTKPYTAMDSWLYDHFIANAVMALKPGLIDELLGQAPQGGRMVEVGSGGGQLAVDVAARRPDVDITGVDLSKEQVARATRRARAVAHRVRFEVGSALALPLPDAAFDVAVSVASIKHWPDQARGLGEMVRVLRPGGLLLVVEADRGCTLADARAFVGRWGTPRLMREPLTVLFRTYVAGQGIDLDDARALIAPLGLDEARAERIPGTPGLMLGGRKR